jgi:DNA-binding MarR family transcriptional regulator
MKLQRPTDFLTLQCLADSGRNVASNVALEIDKSRSHVNVRLPILEDYGLVEKIGPAENSGLYELTPKGRIALAHREEYDAPDVDFDAVVEQELDTTDATDSTVEE